MKFASSPPWREKVYAGERIGLIEEVGSISASVGSLWAALIDPDHAHRCNRSARSSRWRTCGSGLGFHCRADVLEHIPTPERLWVHPKLWWIFCQIHLPVGPDRSMDCDRAPGCLSKAGRLTPRDEGIREDCETFSSGPLHDCPEARRLYIIYARCLFFESLSGRL